MLLLLEATAKENRVGKGGGVAGDVDASNPGLDCSDLAAADAEAAEVAAEEEETFSDFL